MATFLIAASVLVFVTLVLVLRPLLQWKPKVTVAFLAAFALGTALLYQLIGTPAALDPQQRELPRTMDEAIARLEAELQRDPNQVEGLRLLARAYLQKQQPDKARDAYARAIKLAQDDPDLLAEAAEARALADASRRFDDNAIALLQRALTLEPMHQRARWFLGIAQRQRGDALAAVKTWEPLLDAVDARTAEALRPQIADARREAGLPPLPATEAAPEGNAAHAIRVGVQLDPDFAARVRLRGDAQIFVIARIPGGPPMPVAAEKHPVSALPLTLVLDDGDSPMPTQKLSSLQEVEVLARISMDGNAMPQPDDIQSVPVRVRLPATAPVELVLGAAHP